MAAQLKFKITNQTIERVDDFHPVARSQNYLRASFSFTSDWGDDKKVALFYSTGARPYPYAIEIQNNECLVPWEAISTPGTMKVSVHSGNRITADTANVQIFPSGYKEKQSSTSDPSPDIFESILERIKALEETSVGSPDWNAEEQESGYIENKPDIKAGEVPSSLENASSEAFGDNAIALGHKNKAFGAESIATGVYSTAKGDGSLAHGTGYRATAYLTGDANATTYQWTIPSTSFDSGTAEQFQKYVTLFATRPYTWICYVEDESGKQTEVSAFDSDNKTLSTRSTLSDEPLNEARYELCLCIIAVGPASVAVGACNVAKGSYSHAEGKFTIASGDHSHSEGEYTEATAEASHTEGWHTTASGWLSHAEGLGSAASGLCSHAEGQVTVASGWPSHAEGNYTVASHKCQHAFGEFNIEDPSTAVASARGTYVEIVGNGTAENARSNARTLDWNGNEWIKGNLKIGGSSYDDPNAKDLATKDYVEQFVGFNTRKFVLGIGEDDREFDLIFDKACSFVIFTASDVEGGDGMIYGVVNSSGVIAMHRKDASSLNVTTGTPFTLHFRNYASNSSINTLCIIF